jgi:hypothetical protein
LLTRPGHLKLDKNHHPRITKVTHLESELVVARGLNPQDVAWSLNVVPAEQELRKGQFDLEKLRFDYLVHSLGEAGIGGSLVSVEVIEDDPEQWVSPHIMETWDVLSLGGHSPADLGLHGLARYLNQAQLRQAS